MTTTITTIYMPPERISSMNISEVTWNATSDLEYQFCFKFQLNDKGLPIRES